MIEDNTQVVVILPQKLLSSISLYLLLSPFIYFYLPLSTKLTKVCESNIYDQNNLRIAWRFGDFVLSLQSSIADTLINRCLPTKA